MGNTRNIIGSRTACHAGYRIDNIRCRAGRCNYREFARKGNIERRVAAAQGDSWGYQDTVFFNNSRWYSHHLGFVIDIRAMFGEAFPCLLIANQESYFLKNFERGLMYIADIVACQVAKEIHRTSIPKPIISTEQ